MVSRGRDLWGVYFQYFITLISKEFPTHCLLGVSFFRPHSNIGGILYEYSFSS